LPVPSLLLFFTDSPTTVISTLSLHDALPIYGARGRRFGLVRESGRLLDGAAEREPGRPGRRSDGPGADGLQPVPNRRRRPLPFLDRKSTRLNSSHRTISYAVFCLKKKKTKQQ